MQGRSIENIILAIYHIILLIKIDWTFSLFKTNNFFSTSSRSKKGIIIQAKRLDMIKLLNKYL
jgi:hypothetical protein